MFLEIFWHNIFVFVFQLWEWLQSILSTTKPIPKIILGKRPEHVLLIGSTPLTIDQALVLVEFCWKMQVKSLTIVDDYEPKLLKELSKICNLEIWTDEGGQTKYPQHPSIRVCLTKRDPHEYFASTVRALEAPLTTEKVTNALLPTPTVDLLISTQEIIDLSGTIAWCIGFAEIFHRPSEKFITLSILQEAFFAFSSCKQNFGK